MFCHPVVNVDLLTLDAPFPLANLKAAHELLDDGAKFISRITLPLLESTLVPSANGRMWWRGITGGTYELSPQSWTEIKSERYSLFKHVGGESSVVSSEGPVFDYRRGRLVSIHIGEKIFEFGYTRGRLDTIRQITPRAAPILRVHYDAGGAPDLVATAGESVLLARDYEGRIRSLENPSRHLRVAFQYQAALLSRVELSGNPIALKWSAPHWQMLWHPFGYLQPVLSIAGPYSYSVDLTADQCVVQVFSSDGQRIKTWQVKKI